MKLKKLTLIRPNMGSYRARDAMPPLALGILAARTPGEVAVTLYDDRIETIPPDDSPDLVAITVETFTARRAYEISELYRRKGIPVVMGGYHPTLLPEEVSEHADVVVMGDAEGIWEKVIADFESNTLKSLYTGGNERSLDDYVIDRSIFKGRNYLPIELVQYGRGCRYNCDFCSISNFYKQNIRVRSIENLVDEIKGLNRRRLVFFVDDNLFSSKEKFHKLLDAITPLKIRWACQISIDAAADEELLDRLASSGCVLALIGFESLEQENLSQMGKKWNTNSGTYLQVIEKFHDRGIAVYGTFVFGYDRDTAETVDAAVKFAINAELEVANFNLLIPTPGSALYNRLGREGRLIADKWWDDPDYHYGDPTFKPELMAPDVLSASCFEAKKEFYSWSSICRRLFSFRLKFKPFQFVILLIINIVSQKEIKNKHNRLLSGS